MSKATEDRRARLRQALIGVAETRVAESGLAGLRARDVAAAAGCSVGAIYTVFEDLDALALEVNARTFARLGAAVDAAVDPVAPPRARMIAIGHAYLGFAADNTPAWRAIFDLKMSRNAQPPQWYRDRISALFAHIARPLADLVPDWPEERRALMTNALFSSVHGIVLLGLERPAAPAPVAEIERMIALLLSSLSPQLA